MYVAHVQSKPYISISVLAKIVQVKTEYIQNVLTTYGPCSRKGGFLRETLIQMYHEPGPLLQVEKARLL